VTGAPPWTEIFLSLLSAKNPTHWLSGEKNGSRPLSVPDSKVAWAWSSSRVASCCLPFGPSAGKTSRRPSGEMAAVRLSPAMASGPRSTLSRVKG